MKKIAEVLLYILIFLLALRGFADIANGHDKQISRSVTAFENCTVHNYHMTPSEFISKYGQDKTCN